MQYYNRYSEFIKNNGISFIPFIKLTDKSSDKIITYIKGKHNSANLSNDYYGSPYFEFLIRLKNSNLGMDESEWPDNSIVVIPFPLKDSIQDYINLITQYKEKYG